MLNLILLSLCNIKLPRPARRWLPGAVVVLISGTCQAQQDDLSRIGISNDASEFRVQAEIGAMSVELAKQKLEEALIARKEMIRNQLCDQPPTNQLCHHIPKDNTDFSELFVYMFILDTAQDPFDIFSWQSFIAMNWPLDRSGSPAETPIGTSPDAPRVWMRYKTPAELYGNTALNAPCDAIADDDRPILRTSNFYQTGGYPLIDRNLNYIVYDIRINDIMADYVVENGLHSIEGQLEFAAGGGKVEFPLGHYDDPLARSGGMRGSAAVKSAWKIIDTEAGDDPSRYYTMDGLISVDAGNSETGEPLCVEARLGLIGMHIMQRTRSGNGPEWTWSTFEHVDNAPFAGNARKPVDTLHDVLFEGGCSAPADAGRSYTLFNPDCPECKTNQVVGEGARGGWKWSPIRPHARSHGHLGRYGTQVVRCWKVFEGTEQVNSLWQDALAGTVWANYESLSAQWRGAKKSMMFPAGEVPRFLVNSAMETYDQYGTKSSCMGCHNDARSVAGADSNMSFLLSLASRYKQAAEVE